MKKVSLLLILLLAFFLRFYRLNKVPASLFSDEADLGYQAYSVLKTGKDYFGNFLPVHFHSFADFRTPLYLYSAIPTIAVFGLNEWGVRIPAAIYGFLGIIFFYLLVREYSNDKRLALLATFLLTLTPWQIHYSRAGFEITSMLCLLSLGFWLFFRGLTGKKGFYLSPIVLAAAFYSYAPVKLFLPLFLVIFAIVTRKKLLTIGLRKIALSASIFLILLFPIIKTTIWGQANFRFSYLSIFSDPSVAARVNEQRLADALRNHRGDVGLSPSFYSKLVHNKLTVWISIIAKNYLAAVSPVFLFSLGDNNLRHSLPNFGLVLISLAPFYFLGIIKAVTQAKDHWFWLVWFFLAPLASSITRDGANHASRLSLLILPIIYFCALGYLNALSWLKNKTAKNFFIGITLILILTNFIYYWHSYSVHYPQDSEKEWHYGTKQTIEALVKIEKDYDKIYFSSSFEPALIFYLFWSKYPPEKFNAGNLLDLDNSWFSGKVWQEKYYFGRFKSWPPDGAKDLYIFGRNDLGMDLESLLPVESRLLTKVYSLNGEPRFYFLEK